MSDAIIYIFSDGWRVVGLFFAVYALGYGIGAGVAAVKS